MPQFLLEPTDGYDLNDPETRIRLRNDSYIGAVQRDNIMVRAGLQVRLLHFKKKILKNYFDFRVLCNFL